VEGVGGVESKIENQRSKIADPKSTQELCSKPPDEMGKGGKKKL
jgi:hypothetical protein